MGQVTVKVNDRDFSLACDDGQEPRIRRLAQIVDARLILLGALVLVDELAEANDALQRAQSSAPATDAPDATAQSIRDIARRIESIAARRETP